jgi:hypothetical protein
LTILPQTLSFWFATETQAPVAVLQQPTGSVQLVALQTHVLVVAWQTGVWPLHPVGLLSGQHWPGFLHTPLQQTPVVRQTVRSGRLVSTQT